MVNLVLIGFMGTGKTSVGKRVAKRLNMNFLDSDQEIERIAEMSVNDIFRKYGEVRFRSEEKAAIRRITLDDNQVISTGGGVVLDPENINMLKQNGIIICLAAEPEVIYQRVKHKKNRPLLQTEDPLGTINKLLTERRPFYRCADEIVDTSNLDVNQVVEEVTRIYNKRVLSKEKLVMAVNDNVKSLVKVNLGDKSYPIYIGENILPFLGNHVKQLGLGQKVLVVSNPTVLDLYGDTVISSLKAAGFDVVIGEVPDGEKYKSLDSANYLYDVAFNAGFDRKSVILALGGGVIGDLAGFVAATYMRGVPFIQVPTTLLAQVDSSVGGKVAVNHPKGKNIIGVFYQPKLVFADIGVLRTLKEREFRAGMAEVIKYGVIWDSEFFSFLEMEYQAITNLASEQMIRVVETSCSIKARVVEQDETEQGIRAILNFGHTFGHAYEALTEYRKYVHGEAVAIGMVSAARAATEMGMLKTEDADLIENLIHLYGLPNKFEDLTIPEIVESMYHDKKTLAGKIRYILPEAIGQVKIVEDIPHEILYNVLGKQALTI